MDTKKVTLILRSEVDGKEIRYSVNTTQEIADKYAQIREKQPELEETEAFKEARSIQKE